MLSSGLACPRLTFSLETGSSIPHLSSEGTGHLEGSTQEPEVPLPGSKTPPESRGSAAECVVSGPLEAPLQNIRTIRQPGSSTREEPKPPEYLRGEFSVLFPTEPRLLEEAVFCASPSATHVQSLSEPALETPSGSVRAQEAGQPAQLTIAQAIEAYMQEMRAAGRSPKTLQWHQISLRVWRLSLWKQFHLADGDSLTRTCLQTWMSALPMVLSGRTEARRAVSTVATYGRSARAFCNWLVRRGYVSEPPFPPEVVPQAHQRLPKLIEPDVFLRLLRACRLPGPPGGQNAGMTARNHAILWLFLDTGLSIAELCRLCLADVDCVSGVVTIHGTKGGTRTFPLSGNGQRAVCAYLDQVRLTSAWEPAVPEARDRLLLTEQRYPLTKNSLTLLFRRLNQRAKFTKMPICPSMLRDTYAIRFLQTGGTLAALQQQLGIAHRVSVKRYQSFCEQ
ncbi:MAG TPA: tyrosine-type recombinase/integrase [Ktedonobacteraceae bacterium]|nr:tyrosine-type recombinase/integrase [Ktedonobacteraceae bacterium]